MQTQKVIRFLGLLVVIQALAMLYLAREELHAFIDDSLSLGQLKEKVLALTDQLSEPSSASPETFEKTLLPEFRVDVPFANWRWVNATITADTPRTKIPATLHVGNDSYNCTIRVSAGGPRHWMGERKSVRLRFPTTALYKGIRELNINIPETHMVIIEAVAWEFAKIMGLPVPEFGFLNLYINNQYEGVRLYYEDADGFFLRRNNLMGYIFTEVRHSFPFHYESADDRDYPHAKVINKKYGTFDELRYLAKVLSYPDYAQFREQIVKLADLKQIARWYAHALICGSGHQNTHNVKLFFNTAVQKFQWLPWDIAGFGHWGGWSGSNRQIWAMDLDWATNNFTYHLNLLPEFVEERNRILWEYLTGPLSLENQLAIVDKYYKQVRYHLYHDKNRQASETKFDYAEFEKAIRALKAWITKRHAFMLRELEKADLRISYSPYEHVSMNGDHSGTQFADALAISMGTGRQSSVRLTQVIVPEGQQKLDPERLKLFLDANANDRLDSGDREIQIADRQMHAESGTRRVILTVNEKLVPARKTYRDKFFDYEDKGYVLQPRPFHRYYTYFLIYESQPGNGARHKVFTTRVEFVANNAITGTAIQPEYYLNDPEKPFALRYRETTDVGAPGGYSMHIGDRQQSDFISQGRNLADLFRELPRKKQIVVPAGDYWLSESMRIAPDESVTFAAGVRVAFYPGVSILVRGELHTEGTARAPVLLENALNGQAWGCLAYYKSDKISRIRNTIFRYGGMAAFDTVNFTGTISAYYATVHIDSCSFEEIQADDGLNTKYSKSLTFNSRFIAPKDDAIDYDFSEGEIRGCYFYKTGGDAIDCGTANPIIRGNIVEYANDKGVSVGENSSPIIENNIFVNGNYGIAVKDDSSPVIRNNTITGNAIGLSLYIKKPDEFGCPQATVSNTIIWGNQREIENLCKAELVLRNCAVRGGASGEQIFENPAPAFVENERGLRSLIKPGSFYAEKGIGALIN